MATAATIAVLVRGEVKATDENLGQESPCPIVPEVNLDDQADQPDPLAAISEETSTRVGTELLDGEEPCDSEMAEAGANRAQEAYSAIWNHPRTSEVEGDEGRRKIFDYDDVTYNVVAWAESNGSPRSLTVWQTPLGYIGDRHTTMIEISIDGEVTLGQNIRGIGRGPLATIIEEVGGDMGMFTKQCPRGTDCWVSSDEPVNDFLLGDAYRQVAEEAIDAILTKYRRYAAE